MSSATRTNIAYSGQVGSISSSEIRGRMVGFSWDCGHHLTFLILTEDNKQVISRSQVQLAKDGKNNVMLDAQAGDLPKRFYIHSKCDAEDPEKVRLPTLDVSKDPFDLDALETGESSGLKEHVKQIKQQHSDNTNPIVVETVEEDDNEEADSGAKTPMDDTPLTQASEAVPDNDKECIAKKLHPK